MSYSRTIPQKEVAVPATGAGTWKPRARNGAASGGAGEDDPSLHKAKLPYFFLLLFTAVLLGRPSDFIWSLQVIPMAQISALLAVASYVVARLQGSPFIVTMELKIVAALTAIFVLGLPFAFWRQMTYEMLTQDWMKTVIIFLLITQTVFTLSRARRLMWIFILCELVVCFFSLVDPRTGFVQDSTGRARGSTVGFLSGNYLGIAAAITLPYMAVFLVRSRSWFQPLLLVATFGSVMLMVVKTASRSNMICVVISLALVWWFILRHSGRGRVMGMALGSAIAISVALAPGIFWERVSTMWSAESFATADSDARSAMESEFQRKALLRRAITYTLENPVTGLGMGNFAIRSGSQYGAQDWKGAHNTYVQISSEGGVPAFILFLTLLYVTTRNMRRISRAPGDDPATVEMRQMALATAVSVYGFMLSGFFAHLAYDFYLYYLIGISVCLQAVWRRQVAQGLTTAVAGSARKQNGAFRRASGKAL